MNLRLIICAGLLLPTLNCGTDDSEATDDGPVRTVTIYQFAAPPSDALVAVQVEVAATGDVAADAVTALLTSEPVATSRDSLWSRSSRCAPGPRVASVTATSELVTVNLHGYASDEVGNATCDLGEAGFDIQIQQMVRTVQGAVGSDAPVEILVDEVVYAGPTQSDLAGRSGRFDPLTIWLELPSNRVASGHPLHTRLHVANHSDGTVVDPSRDLAAGRSALVPVKNPDAELWMRPVVDCGGSFAMSPGFRATWTGPDFMASTKYGDPLPPGDYLAVLDISGRTSRLEIPVTVY